MNAEVVAKKPVYTGLFMVVLATLMFEILLTRIFSVSMWYHFAFMAISVAMFGMTLGAILVYLLPNYFTQDRAKYHLALSSLLFAVFVVVSFLTHLSIPFAPDRSIAGLYSIALTYAVISIPFVFSGICVCLALTRFPRQVSKIYAADLTGAAIGCLLPVYVLKIVDGPTAVIVVALFAGIGSILFATDATCKKLRGIVIIFSLLLGSFAAIQAVFSSKQFPLLRLIWVKGQFENRPIYEKWNSFSRVRVWGNPNEPRKPFGWGLSSAYPFDQKVRELNMDIDAYAYTPITAFDGNLSDLEYMKYDVTNLVHYIRPESRVLIIGVGGGRDILSALAFEQKSVIGVEINNDIIKIVNQRFGDFTGHLDRNPKITFINDDARSYIARQKDKFDIIQSSFIDTYAATSAGAFVLTEDSLYTVEAWKIFLEHLTSDGVLTFSRWYWERPSEVYRLTSLARASLMHLGIENPRNHIVIVRHMRNNNWGVATILVGKKPFKDKDLDTIDAISSKMKFDVLLSPRVSLDSTYTIVASAKNADSLMERFPTNITAPTDDSPFFFLTLRLRDVFNRELWKQEVRKRDINTTPVLILGILLTVVAGLTFLCIIVPLILTKKVILRGFSPLVIFFAFIGFGFMLVEISQMQRLIIFLGHPTYGLSVVLFALLLSSGLGSYSTQKMDNFNLTRSAIIRLFFLLCLLAIFGKLTSYAMSEFQGSTTMLRILVAIGVLFPIGLFMGMAFPIGMKIASTKSASLTPWLWGINGATSVCASVLAVIIAISSGISTTFWTGFACYIVAFAAFAWTRRRKD
jgi:spermidine synthase